MKTKGPLVFFYFVSHFNPFSYYVSYKNLKISAKAWSLTVSPVLPQRYNKITLIVKIQSPYHVISFVDLRTTVILPWPYPRFFADSFNFSSQIRFW